MANAANFFGIPVIGAGTPNATADATLLTPTHTVTLLGGQGPRIVTDAVTNSTTLITSATVSWNSGDIGRPISGAGIPVGTVIQSFASGTNATMSAPATASASGVTATLGGGIGTKVEEVYWIPNTNASPTVAGTLTLYLYDGTNYRYIDESQVTAVTPTTTVPIAATQFVRSPYTNLWIPPTWTLVFSSTVASQLTSVTAVGANS